MGDIALTARTSRVYGLGEKGRFLGRSKHPYYYAISAELWRDKMNQYWSLSGPVLVSNSDQYYFVS